MAELLTHPRQTALYPRDIFMVTAELPARLRRRQGAASVKISEGPGSLIWRSNPGPPAVTEALRRAVQHSLYARSPRCCPAPGGRARGRCRRRIGSLIAGAAAGGFACAAGVTEGKSTAGRAVHGSAGRRPCGRRVDGIKGAAVARTYTRTGNGGTGHGARCGGARGSK
jgi:hypothetical protein